ncbi:MAG: HEPN domain-containing protein [Rubrobacter sp.]|nr:HEPN domain-containing protein [Rubrobacter sp.]
MAELAFGESLWNQVCFHAHQAAEKNLKALVAHRDESPPKTHKLADLSTLLEGEEPSLKDISDEILSLDSYYIPTRYPDALPGSLPEGSPGEGAAGEALEAARRVARTVRKSVESAG